MSMKEITEERLTFHSSGDEEATVNDDSGDVVAFINASDEYGNLFAAAPDLLAACKKLCRQLESNEMVNRPDDPCNYISQPDYDFAVAAIRKAEGK